MREAAHLRWGIDCRFYVRMSSHGCGALLALLSQLNELIEAPTTQMLVLDLQLVLYMPQARCPLCISLQGTQR